MSTWNLDKAHSNIGFKVKHMMITNVSGEFTDFDVQLAALQPDFSDANIQFEAKVASINTKNEQRDAHLKSADFFDADSFSVIKFVSSSFTKKSETDYLLEGTLTIKGVSKTVKLDVEYGGTFVDPWGVAKAGFSLQGKISRDEFNLGWNAVLESGGVLVSNEVKLFAELQFSKA